MADLISVINPATAALIQTIPGDDRAAIAQKVSQARQAQPGWAALAPADRMAPIQRFRDRLIEQADTLAALLTSETGKPITQARNEILAVPGRIDFFLEHTLQVLTPERVYGEPADALPGTGGLEEVISYDPLGVIANISAWNYPYFVGSNVFVPALLLGNAVLYKPSEFATLTGLAIADLLHASGIPQDIFMPVVGTGLTGAALLEQPIDGVFFTGSYATGQKIAVAAAPQMMRVQLELGGKDPAYVCATTANPAIAAAGLADGAFYNNGTPGSRAENGGGFGEALAVDAFGIALGGGACGMAGGGSAGIGTGPLSLVASAATAGKFAHNSVGSTFWSP